MCSSHLGSEAICRIDTSTPSTRRHILQQSLKQQGSLVRVVLMSSSCLGIGTDLPNVDVVVIVDSDWHPILDIQVSDTERGALTESLMQLAIVLDFLES